MQMQHKFHKIVENFGESLMSRPIRALIYPERLSANLQTLKSLAPATELNAVIKANAYGHGIEHVFSGLSLADGLASGM